MTNDEINKILPLIKWILVNVYEIYEDDEINNILKFCQISSILQELKFDDLKKMNYEELDNLIENVFIQCKLKYIDFNNLEKLLDK